MEQRRLRLGDILDDYCPRERRVTNHAVVAMIEENVKQTRCTTCDAEHAYKGGKEPRRRKKDATAALYQEVLAGIPDAADVPAVSIPEPVPSLVATLDEPEPGDDPDGSEDADRDEAPQPADAGDDGPFHRRLIRATLPRPEGQKEVRQEPDFTIRSNTGRGGANGAHRGGFKARNPGAGNGSRGQGGRRFGGGGQNQGAANGRGARGGGRPGFGGGNQRQGGGGRKRSR